MNGAGEIVNQVGVGIWVQQFGLSSNSDFLGAGADGVALLVAVGTLMHVFAVRTGAGMTHKGTRSARYPILQPG